MSSHDLQRLRPASSIEKEVSILLRPAYNPQSVTIQCRYDSLTASRYWQCWIRKAKSDWQWLPGNVAVLDAPVAYSLSCLLTHVTKPNRSPVPTSL